MINDSLYAARTPAVIIDFEEMAIRFIRRGLSGDWTVIDNTDSGDITAIQWTEGRIIRYMASSPVHSLTLI